MTTKTDHSHTTPPPTSANAIALGAAQRLTSQYMTKHELAAVLGKSPKTIERWVRTRTGPAFTRTGNTLRFHIDSVVEWMKHNEVRIDTNTRYRRA